MTKPIVGVIAAVLLLTNCLSDVSETQIARDAGLGTADDDGQPEDLSSSDLSSSDLGDEDDIGCVPGTDTMLCAQLDAECGAVTTLDGCGASREIVCGNCALPNVCGGAGVPNHCGCPGETDDALCAAAAVECGPLGTTDACGQAREASCGNCDAPETCIAGVCGCDAESDSELCERIGAACGTAITTDSCGFARTIDCGSCAPPQTCGGGGTQNVCACDSESDVEFCARYNAMCGALQGLDACSQLRTVDCGACSAPEVCAGAGTANLCECVPESDAALCQRVGAGCGAGVFLDNCGAVRAVDCGGCASGQACQGNICVCAAENDADLCIRKGAECGSLQSTDNCGVSRTVNCGACLLGSCSSNLCVGAEICTDQTDNDGDDKIDCDDSDCNDAACSTVFPDAHCVSGTCCTPQNDLLFCLSNNAECGSVQSNDNCGDPRDVDCGSCPTQTVCEDGRCICNNCNRQNCDGLRCDASNPNKTCQSLECRD